MRYSHALSFAVLATLLVQYALAFFHNASNGSLLVLFLICTVIGLSSYRIALSVSSAVSYAAFMTTLSSVLAFAGLGGGVVYAPVNFFNAFYVRYSGSVNEIFSMVLVVVVALLGGVVGFLIIRGSMVLLGVEASTETHDELRNLRHKLEELRKERNKLEEELRICNIIEQGAKKRLARNELSQNDYEAIIRDNESHRDKLNGRIDELQTEMNTLQLSIEAREKAREMQNSPAQVNR